MENKKENENRNEDIPLKNVYENLREKILEEALERDLYPEYKYENQTGFETPIGFSNHSYGVKFRDTKLFELLVRGNLDELKEVYGNNGEFKELIKEIFGPNLEDDTEKDKENQWEIEMAA